MNRGGMTGHAAALLTIFLWGTTFISTKVLLTGLRPDIIIHRVVADPAPGELVAPDWATRKGDLVRFIQHAYHKKVEEREGAGKDA